MDDINEMFCHAFSGGGSIRTTCDCGREHYEYDAPFENPERIELQNKNAANPDKCIEHNRVSTLDVDGKHFVLDCPCAGYKPYANFIWRHRLQILEYLSERTKHDLELAEHAMRKVAEAAKITDKAHKSVLKE